MKHLHPTHASPPERIAHHPRGRGHRAATATVAWLRTWWQRALQDEETRFLSDAEDLAHLERRLRAIQRGRWHQPSAWTGLW